MYNFDWLKSLCLLLLVALGGCSSTESPELNLGSVSIYTDVDANQNSATPVDLVLIYDSQLIQVFGKMPAEQYFKNSSQLKRDNPATLDIWHWELVPGQTVENFKPNTSGKAFAGYVFANYITPGEHRVRVNPDGEIKVILLKTDIKDLTLMERIRTPDLRPAQSVVVDEVFREEATRRSTISGNNTEITYGDRNAEPCGVRQETESYIAQDEIYENPETCELKQEIAMEIRGLEESQCVKKDIPFQMAPTPEPAYDILNRGDR